MQSFGNPTTLPVEHRSSLPSYGGHACRRDIICHPDRQEKREPAGSKPVSLGRLLRKPAYLDAGSSHICKYKLQLFLFCNDSKERKIC